MAVLELPLVMQNLLFAIPRNARRLLGTVIWVSLSVITQIFRTSFRRHVAGINQGTVLQLFNLAYLDFSVRPLRLGTHSDFSSRMTAYVQWAQLTDDQLAIALERARVRRNRDDNLPDDPLHFSTDPDWNPTAHGIADVLHLLMPVTFNGLENCLVIKYGRAGGADGFHGRLRAHRLGGTERFVRNEANRRHWHHRWLDSEGRQREELLVIPPDQLPEVERMFRALMLVFPA
ncbi:hypothetical protein PHYSODRAFT_332887 [Phytophthora sojae]|uniref:Uncharacterized protein n=1 Tax=Phytophthora sojae (strain P6497) TaxID=1094619 RepID=G4ZKR3_PHYSP|nr:hypothetical protein PHYSODRAFT_332887 [Phytophthora sojae]EGZ14509.1 hypothetical protein PHYSODRAFT_332887 [Phytophthora sojae]|eukprot:XP_009528258.1 hypothetical protein PHYSODRAFT_332887 [Phytophthora sojae]